MNKRNKAEGELPSVWHFHSGKYLLFSFGLLCETVLCMCNHEHGLKSLWLLPFQVGQTLSPEPGMNLQSHGWGPAGRILLSQASVPLLSQVPAQLLEPFPSSGVWDVHSVTWMFMWLRFSLLWKWGINWCNPGESDLFKGKKKERSPGCPPMHEKSVA